MMYELGRYTSTTITTLSSLIVFSVYLASCGDSPTTATEDNFRLIYSVGVICMDDACSEELHPKNGSFFVRNIMLNGVPISRPFSWDDPIHFERKYIEGLLRDGENFISIIADVPKCNSYNLTLVFQEHVLSPLGGETNHIGDINFAIDDINTTKTLLVSDSSLKGAISEGYMGEKLQPVGQFTDVDQSAILDKIKTLRDNVEMYMNGDNSVWPFICEMYSIPRSVHKSLNQCPIQEINERYLRSYDADRFLYKKYSLKKVKMAKTDNIHFVVGAKAVYVYATTKEERPFGEPLLLYGENYTKRKEDISTFMFEATRMIFVRDDNDWALYGSYSD